MKRTIVEHVLPSLGLSVIFTMCGILLLTRASHRIIHSWEQPKHIEYQRNAVYSLHIREKAPYWHVLPPFRSRRHEVFIGWSDSYGHWFDCTFHAGSLDDDEIDAYIQRSTVEWTGDGVSIKQESGHVIHFPKKTFIGGR